MVMARQKIYKVEYIDPAGIIQEEMTFQTESHKEAMAKAMHYKRYVLQYPGPGKYKTILTRIRKL